MSNFDCNASKNHNNLIAKRCNHAELKGQSNSQSSLGSNISQ
jgi:hypothetical protein